jgi:ABC-type transporter Mla subunit MlaD
MKGKIMDDENPEERDTADETHRVGEFDDLRDMLRSVLDKVSAISDRTDAISERIDGIYDNFTDSVAQMVENGATVKENDDDVAEAIAQAAAEDLENLDYAL